MRLTLRPKASAISTGDVQDHCDRLVARLQVADLTWHDLVGIARDCDALAHQLEAAIRQQEMRSGRSRETRIARAALPPLWTCVSLVQPYRPYKPPAYLREQLYAALQGVDYAVIVLHWARMLDGPRAGPQLRLLGTDSR